MEQDFDLILVVEDDYVQSATFEILKKSVDEYGGDVNDDGGDRDEHLANIRHNFDYPIIKYF